jgi:hypothetical protein
MFEDGFIPWRLMSVCFFNFVAIFSSACFRFRLTLIRITKDEKVLAIFKGLML